MFCPLSLKRLAFRQLKNDSRGGQGLAAAAIAIFSVIGGILAIVVGLVSGGLSLWLVVYFFCGCFLGGLVALALIVVRVLITGDDMSDVSAEEAETDKPKLRFEFS
ncbi:hypothetical protein N9O61_00820 [Octadecabacter sp.]|nr:hypothetical protein [Octadecabacter sp.]